MRYSSTWSEKIPDISYFIKKGHILFGQQMIETNQKQYRLTFHYKNIDKKSGFLNLSSQLLFLFHFYKRVKKGLKMRKFLICLKCSGSSLKQRITDGITQ